MSASLVATRVKPVIGDSRRRTLVEGVPGPIRLASQKIPLFRVSAEQPDRAADGADRGVQRRPQVVQEQPGTLARLDVTPSRRGRTPAPMLSTGNWCRVATSFANAIISTRAGPAAWHRSFRGATRIEDIGRPAQQVLPSLLGPSQKVRNPRGWNHFSEICDGGRTTREIRDDQRGCW